MLWWRVKAYNIPIANKVAAPIFFAFDMCNCHITVCGSKRITTSDTKLTNVEAIMTTFISRQRPSTHGFQRWGRGEHPNKTAYDVEQNIEPQKYMAYPPKCVAKSGGDKDARPA
jgi:hypothetical protein